MCDALVVVMVGGLGSRTGFLTLTSPAKVNVKRAGKPIAEPKHFTLQITPKPGTRDRAPAAKTGLTVVRPSRYEAFNGPYFLCICAVSTGFHHMTRLDGPWCSFRPWSPFDYLHVRAAA